MTPPIVQGTKHFLVIVADESKAIAYTRASKSGPLQESHAFENQSARLKTGDILADKGGRSFDSHGRGRHTMVGDPKQHLAEGFARDIAEHIATDVRSGQCRGYALVAAPHFLGMLRAELSSHTSTKPYVTVDKNVAGQAKAVIEELLAET